MPKSPEVVTGLFCPACGAEKLFKKSSDIAQSGRSRWCCKDCGSRTTRPLSGAPQVLPNFSKKKASRYIVTSAVNDTPVHPEYWRTLVAMAEKLNARLIVIATVYKNPDMTRQGFLETLSWPVEVLPYICQEKFQINRNLILRGDARIRVTAINPLTGANHAGDVKSEIFGHPQLAMEMVATPKDSIPKMITTTGTVSQPNYGGSWTAKKAEFHHSFNAQFVEVRGDKFWNTQLPWDGKGVQLFDRYYTPTSSRRAPKLAGVYYGDGHRDAQSPIETANTLALFNGLKAQKNMMGDILDFHSGSHHKAHVVVENLRRPDFDVRKELDRALAYIMDIPNCVVIGSNHHDHLDQWFNRYDPRRADQNITLYADLMELVRKYNCGLFEAYCRDKGVVCEFTNPNIEYDIAGIDCAQHGDRGPNGSRGSAKAFAKTGRKTIIGHSHTPMIAKGSWQVGTSAMGMAYAQGYSTWMVAHVLIAATGKRSMIFLVNGEMSPMLKSALKNNKFI